MNPHPDTPDARGYNRAKRWLKAIDTVLVLGFLLGLLATGWNITLRDLCVRVAGEHYVLQLFLYGFFLATLSKLLTTAVDFYGFRLEHRYQLSVQSAGDWAKDALKVWLIRFVLVIILAEITYALIRISPLHWWIIAWVLFVVAYVVFAQIAPLVLFPLFYKFVPLENEELKQRLLRLNARAGTRVHGVYEWKLSEKSKKANAALAGLGNTRRILLSDTLLKEHDNDEIEAMLAHELGHHVHGHILKRVLMRTALGFASFWSAHWVLDYAAQRSHMFQTLSDFAGLPLLALVSTVVSILLAPAWNAYSRFHERQADLYCWKSLASVTPFITAMEKMSVQNLGERSPSRLVEVVFHDHPAVSRRIAAAELWAERQPLR